MKIYTNEFGHMTNMATMPIYGDMTNMATMPIYGENRKNSSPEPVD